MQWENLTSPQFVKALETSKGVCLLPLAVIEKHGDHLPLGTDMFIAQELTRRAAELEPALVFPTHILTQIYEARHTPGTVGIESHVMVDVLQSLCDEIARNGLKKIILVNCHGGNISFLQHFVMLQLERPRDYVVYLPDMLGADDELREAWAKVSQSTFPDYHAGENETSLILATHPDLVDRSTLPNDKGRPLGRLSHLQQAGIMTPSWWFGDFPHHYSGQGEYGTAEKGELVLGNLARRLAAVIRIVKEDTRTPQVQREFFDKLTNGPVND